VFLVSRSVPKASRGTEATFTSFYCPLPFRGGQKEEVAAVDEYPTVKRAAGQLFRARLAQEETTTSRRRRSWLWARTFQNKLERKLRPDTIFP
jgi:hypothetical protein